MSPTLPILNNAWIEQNHSKASMQMIHLNWSGVKASSPANSALLCCRSGATAKAPSPLSKCKIRPRKPATTWKSHSGGNPNISVLKKASCTAVEKQTLQLATLWILAADRNKQRTIDGKICFNRLDLRATDWERLACYGSGHSSRPFPPSHHLGVLLASIMMGDDDDLCLECVFLCDFSAEEKCQN